MALEEVGSVYSPYKFFKGDKKTIDNFPITEGNQYLDIKNATLYIDANGIRVPIGMETLDTIEELTNKKNGFYYVKEDNSLYQVTNGSPTKVAGGSNPEIVTLLNTINTITDWNDYNINDTDSVLSAFLGYELKSKMLLSNSDISNNVIKTVLPNVSSLEDAVFTAGDKLKLLVNKFNYVVEYLRSYNGSNVDYNKILNTPNYLPNEFALKLYIGGSGSNRFNLSSDYKEYTYTGEKSSL